MLGASCFALGSIPEYVRAVGAAAEAMTFFAGFLPPSRKERKEEAMIARFYGSASGNPSSVSDSGNSGAAAPANMHSGVHDQAGERHHKIVGDYLSADSPLRDPRSKKGARHAGGGRIGEEEEGSERRRKDRSFYAPILLLALIHPSA
jgi:hypothetical protein